MADLVTTHNNKLQTLTCQVILGTVNVFDKYPLSNQSSIPKIAFWEVSIGSGDVATLWSKVHTNTAVEW